MYFKYPACHAMFFWSKSNPDDDASRMEASLSKAAAAALARAAAAWVTASSAMIVKLVACWGAASNIIAGPAKTAAEVRCKEDCEGGYKGHIAWFCISAIVCIQSTAVASSSSSSSHQQCSSPTAPGQAQTVSYQALAGDHLHQLSARACVFCSAFDS